MPTGVVTPFVGTAVENTLLKGGEEETEDVSSYYMALRKREGTGI
jgi:hypothetical protein